MTACLVCNGYCYFDRYTCTSPTLTKKYVVSLFVKDPNNKNMVNCDEKLRSILLGKRQVELVELPALIKLHFPKEPK